MMRSLPDLAAATRAVRHLPPLPAVAAEVLATLGSADPDTDAVAELLVRDTALAARTLRVANSPYFGLQGHVASVHEAVVVLGLSSVRALVVASALTQTLSHRRAAGFDPLHFWRHSLATAAAASTIAKAVGAEADLLFLAGVMHDLGRLALAATFPDAFDAVVARKAATGGSWLDAERGVLGFDHAQIGGALCDHWRFPPSIGAAVTGHHVPTAGAAALQADILHVADVIAHALDLVGDEDEAVPALSTAAWGRLGLGWGQLHDVLESTEGQFNGLVAMLG